jgi:hypothetical protein
MQREVRAPPHERRRHADAGKHMQISLSKAERERTETLRTLRSDNEVRSRHG